MYVMLSSGKDSFREQRGSPRRNVECQIIVKSPQCDEFEYVAAAYTKKRRGLGESRIKRTMYATSKVQNSPGRWFETNYECANGTIFLVEFKKWSPTSQFDVETTYLGLLADETAPLYNVVAQLPPHFLAEVNALTFTGRFHIIDENLLADGIVSEADQIAMANMFSIGVEDLGTEVFDRAELEDVFDITMLEAAQVETNKVVKNEKTGRIKIRRGRRVRLR